MAHDDADRPLGPSSLCRDLTPEELAAAPVLASVDALLIDDLFEDEAFAAAVTDSSVRAGIRRHDS